MARLPCAICDNTNQTMRLCPECRRDPANEGWSQDAGLDGRKIVSADTDVDITGVVTNDLANFMSRRSRQVPVARQKALNLLYHFTIRLPYRNRGRGRRRPDRHWVWRRRALSLAEVAWLIGETRHLVEKGLRTELEIKPR